MSSFRRRVGEVYVIAEQREDGSWRVDVTDAFYKPIEDPKARADALHSVLDELSSLRAHVWTEELGNKKSPGRG